MTEAQLNHLDEIKARFDELVSAKYARGAAEHGGNLFDLTADELINEALGESIDQVTYLMTLAAARSRNEDAPVRVSGQDSTAINLVREEMQKAELQHGPLTKDHQRALAILMEEVGESSAALLELGRIERLSCTSEDRQMALVHAKLRVSEELTQVASVAIQMITNLRSELES